MRTFIFMDKQLPVKPKNSQKYVSSPAAVVLIQQLDVTIEQTDRAWIRVIKNLVQKLK